MRTWFLVPVPILLLTVALTIGIAAAAPSFPPDICPCVGGGGEVTAEHEVLLDEVSTEDGGTGDQAVFFYDLPILSGTISDEDSLNPADNLPFN